MKYGHRKILLRQNKRTSVFFPLILALASILIEIFFIDYMITRGLEMRILNLNAANLEFTFPILNIQIIGMVILLLTSWAHLFENPFSIHKKNFVKNNKSLIILRMFNKTILLLFILCFFLFVPSILSSNWFLKYLLTSGVDFPFLKTFSVGFYNLFIKFMNISAVWKFVFLQISASIAILITSLFSRIKSNRK